MGNPWEEIKGANASPQFDLDYAAWVATQPSAPPLYCGDTGGS
jgi:hypothetical protein